MCIIGVLAHQMQLTLIEAHGDDPVKLGKFLSCYGNNPISLHDACITLAERHHIDFSIVNTAHDPVTTHHIPFIYGDHMGFHINHPRDHMHDIHAPIDGYPHIGNGNTPIISFHTTYDYAHFANVSFVGRIND